MASAAVYPISHAWIKAFFKLLDRGNAYDPARVLATDAVKDSMPFVKWPASKDGLHSAAMLDAQRSNVPADQAEEDCITLTLHTVRVCVGTLRKLTIAFFDSDKEYYVRNVKWTTSIASILATLRLEHSRFGVSVYDPEDHQTELVMPSSMINVGHCVYASVFLMDFGVPDSHYTPGAGSYMLPDEELTIYIGYPDGEDESDTSSDTDTDSDLEEDECSIFDFSDEMN